MTLERQTNERTTPLPIADEEVSIPSQSPYTAALLEVPDSANGVALRRISAMTKYGTGSGNFVSGGYYTGFLTANYRLQIDTAGDIDGAATFKWGTVSGGSVTWKGTLMSIDSADPIELELGITVTPSPGTGQDFNLDDYWDFSAEYWTEVEYIPTATMEYQVDYATGKILFHSADTGKTVYGTYEGRGSLADAESLNQLIDYLESGDWISDNISALSSLIVVNDGDLITDGDEIVYI